MDFSFDTTLKTRKILHHYLEKLSLEQLNKVPEGFSNNIFWNIKHVVVTQQLLTYGLSNLPLNISPEEVSAYKKGTAPREEISATDVARCKKQLFELIEKTKDDYAAGLFKEYTEYTVTTKSTLTNVEDAIAFNNFHEGIHLGYTMALLKVI